MSKKQSKDYPNHRSVGYLDFHAVFDVLVSRDELNEMKYGDVKALETMLSVGEIGKEIKMVKTFREEITKAMVKKGIQIPKSLVINLI